MGSTNGLQLLTAVFVSTLTCALATGQTFDASIELDSDQVLAVAYSPDGHLLAGGGFGAAIHIWDARTGKLVHSLECLPRTARRSLAFSPDGNVLASSGDDGVLRFWSMRTGALERSLPAPAKSVYLIASIAFSANGQQLAVVSRAMDGPDRGASEVSLLDLRNGKSRWTWIKPESKWVNSVAFSPNGKKLAVADGQVRLFNAETGALVKTLGVNGNSIFRAAFSPDGNTLAGAGGDWRANP
jgi:WD40 repeat protein